MQGSFAEILGSFEDILGSIAKIRLECFVIHMTTSDREMMRAREVMLVSTGQSSLAEI